MTTSTGKGAASKPAVEVVNNAPATDPDTLKATRIEQADAAVASAEAKVAKVGQHVADFSGEKKERQEEHLKAAKEALAQATAARKELG